MGNLLFRLSPTRSPTGSLSVGMVVVLALSSFAPAKEREAGTNPTNVKTRPFAGAKGDFAMVGALTCSSVACHGSQPAEPGRSRVREAYLNWIQFDPHAQTRGLLASERYEAIVQRLEQSGHERATTSSRCAKCHDPAAMPGADLAAAGQGVGCESCHGNAEKWLTRHYERDISKQELLSLGMIDTKSLPQRAAACAKCHVGSSDQDMNHDMIAAGHPPLRFELAAYHDLIKFKHWNDGPERLAKKDFQVQLWSAGQTASAQAKLELLAARAKQLQIDAGQQPKQVWTEFAEFSCFSCHQRIQPDAGTVGEQGAKGLPIWSCWHTTFADQLLAQPESLKESLQSLSQQRLSVDPHEMIRLSQSARDELTRAESRLPLDRQQLLEWLIAVLRDPQSPSDWETRSQQYLAVVAVVRAEQDELAKGAFLNQWSLAEHEERQTQVRQWTQELNQLGESLRFQRAPRGVPPAGVVLIDEPVKFRDNRQQFGPALLKVAEQLAEQHHVRMKP